MELKAFVKSILLDLNEAVDEVRDKVNRDIKFVDNDSNRTVEFDVAVTVESKKAGSGGGKIKIWQIAEGGAEVSGQLTDTTVSRVKFGLQIDSDTKQEAANKKEESKQKIAERKAGIVRRQKPRTRLHV